MQVIQFTLIELMIVCSNFQTLFLSTRIRHIGSLRYSVNWKWTIRSCSNSVQQQVVKTPPHRARMSRADELEYKHDSTLTFKFSSNSRWMIWMPRQWAQNLIWKSGATQTVTLSTFLDTDFPPTKARECASVCACGGRGKDEKSSDFTTTSRLDQSTAASSRLTTRWP